FAGYIVGGGFVLRRSCHMRRLRQGSEVLLSSLGIGDREKTGFNGIFSAAIPEAENGRALGAGKACGGGSKQDGASSQSGVKEFHRAPKTKRSTLAQTSCWVADSASCRRGLSHKVLSMN